MSLGLHTTNLNESRRGFNTGRILSSDPDKARAIADSVVDFIVSDLGYQAEDVLPALAAVLVVFSLQTADPRQALDETVGLLDEDQLGDILSPEVSE